MTEQEIRQIIREEIRELLCHLMEEAEITEQGEEIVSVYRRSIPELAYVIANRHYND